MYLQLVLLLLLQISEIKTKLADSTLGLSYINKLQPISYNRNPRFVPNNYLDNLNDAQKLEVNKHKTQKYIMDLVFKMLKMQLLLKAQILILFLLQN